MGSRVAGQFRDLLLEESRKADAASVQGSATHCSCNGPPDESSKEKNAGLGQSYGRNVDEDESPFGHDPTSSLTMPLQPAGVAEARPVKEPEPRPHIGPRSDGPVTTAVPAHDLCVVSSRDGGTAALVTIHSQSLGSIQVLAHLSAEGMEALLAGEREATHALIGRHRDDLVGRFEDKGLSCSVEVGSDGEAVMASFREKSGCAAQGSDGVGYRGACPHPTVPVDIIRLS